MLQWFEEFNKNNPASDEARRRTFSASDANDVSWEAFGKKYHKKRRQSKRKATQKSQLLNAVQAAAEMRQCTLHEGEVPDDRCEATSAIGRQDTDESSMPSKEETIEFESSSRGSEASEEPGLQAAFPVEEETSVLKEPADREKRERNPERKLKRSAKKADKGDKNRRKQDIGAGLSEWQLAQMLMRCGSQAETMRRIADASEAKSESSGSSSSSSNPVTDSDLSERQLEHILMKCIDNSSEELRRQALQSQRKEATTAQDVGLRRQPSIKNLAKNVPATKTRTLTSLTDASRVSVGDSEYGLADWQVDSLTQDLEGNEDMATAESHDDNSSRCDSDYGLSEQQLAHMLLKCRSSELRRRALTSLTDASCLSVGDSEFGLSDWQIGDLGQNLSARRRASARDSEDDTCSRRDSDCGLSERQLAQMLMKCTSPELRRRALTSLTEASCVSILDKQSGLAPSQTVELNQMLAERLRRESAELDEDACSRRDSEVGLHEHVLAQVLTKSSSSRLRRTLTSLTNASCVSVGDSEYGLADWQVEGLSKELEGRENAANPSKEDNACSGCDSDIGLTEVKLAQMLAKSGSPKIARKLTTLTNASRMSVGDSEYGLADWQVEKLTGKEHTATADSEDDTCSRRVSDVGLWEHQPKMAKTLTSLTNASRLSAGDSEYGLADWQLEDLTKSLEGKEHTLNNNPEKSASSRRASDPGLSEQQLLQMLLKCDSPKLRRRALTSLNNPSRLSVGDSEIGLSPACSRRDTDANEPSQVHNWRSSLLSSIESSISSAVGDGPSLSDILGGPSEGAVESSEAGTGEAPLSCSIDSCDSGATGQQASGIGEVKDAMSSGELSIGEAKDAMSSGELSSKPVQHHGSPSKVLKKRVSFELDSVGQASLPPEALNEEIAMAEDHKALSLKFAAQVAREEANYAKALEEEAMMVQEREAQELFRLEEGSPKEQLNSATTVAGERKPVLEVVEDRAKTNEWKVTMPYDVSQEQERAGQLLIEETHLAEEASLSDDGPAEEAAVDTRASRASFSQDMEEVYYLQVNETDDSDMPGEENFDQQVSGQSDPGAVYDDMAADLAAPIYVRAEIQTFDTYPSNRTFDDDSSEWGGWDWFNLLDLSTCSMNRGCSRLNPLNRLQEPCSTPCGELRQAMSEPCTACHGLPQRMSL